MAVVVDRRVTTPHVRVRFRKSRGLWEVDHRDRNGRRHRPLSATEEEAHEEATKAIRELGQVVVPVAANRDITIKDYAEQWLVNIETEKEPATVRNYTERLRRHVLPAFGHLKIRELHRVHIKALIGDRRRQGHSKNSVRLIKASLSAMLSEAVNDGIIDAYAPRRGAPAVVSPVGVLIIDDEPLMREGLGAYMDHGRGSRYQAPRA